MSDMKMYNILGKFNNLDPNFKPLDQIEKATTPVYEEVTARGSITEAVKGLEEKYMGFKAVEKAAEKGGAKDPAAVAASIGRKKYGKAKFQKAAAAGKKMGESKLDELQADSKTKKFRQDQKREIEQDLEKDALNYQGNDPRVKELLNKIKFAAPGAENHLAQMAVWMASHEKREQEAKKREQEDRELIQRLQKQIDIEHATNKKQEERFRDYTNQVAKSKLTPQQSAVGAQAIQKDMDAQRKSAQTMSESIETVYEEEGPIEIGAQPEHHDMEGDSAKTSIHTIIRVATELEKALADNEDLEEWVSEKIGAIKGMVVNVADHVISKHERDHEHATGKEGIHEGKKLKDKKQFDDTAEKGDYYITSKGNKVIKTDTGVKHEKVHAGDDDDKDDLDESAKPDFLDVDKDGDKKEPFKKAVKDKEQVDELVRVKPQGNALSHDFHGHDTEGQRRNTARSVKLARSQNRASGGPTKGAKSGEYDGAGSRTVSTYNNPLTKAFARPGPQGKTVDEATEFGDTIKNSEGKMTKVKVTEGKDAIRNHPIYTTTEAWNHYAQELEEEMLKDGVLNVQQELDEIAALAGITPAIKENGDPSPFEESTCPTCSTAPCKCEEGKADLPSVNTETPLSHELSNTNCVVCNESPCSCSHEEQEMVDEATRKDFEMVASLIKNLENREKAKELAYHHDKIFAKSNPRYDSKKFLAACDLDECDWNMNPGMEPVVDEADMEEGNEFSGELAKAKAAHKDSFEVDGKQYPVKEQHANKNVVNRMKRPIENLNTPREDYAAADITTMTGTGLDKKKTEIEFAPPIGDNPLQAKRKHAEIGEAALWKKYEDMLNEITK